MTSTGARGPYAKSAGRRADIIAQATEAFSTSGFFGSSQREIAAAAGITQPGLVHHFGTKEALLEAVLEHKDLATLDAFDDADVLDGLREVVAHNLAQPGLVRLFTTLAAETVNPAHPGHEHFADRYDKVRDLLAGVLERGQTDEQVAPSVDPHLLAVLVTAVMDGLQLQWLHDPEVDVRAAFDAFLALLTP